MGKKKSRTVYAEFHRKPLDGWELADPVYPGETWKVQIEKGVELSKETFEQFQEELYRPYEFLYENSGYMYFDGEGQCAHSLLVTTPERREGILVQSEGFSYVRYGAYIPDCGVFDLSAIPWESHVPRQTEPEQKTNNRKPKQQKRERGER